jgi:hypothetical protein
MCDNIRELLRKVSGGFHANGLQKMNNVYLDLILHVAGITACIHNQEYYT